MPINVHCACGNAIDCDALELVETLRCPVCERELTIEFLTPQRKRCRLVLRVMDGPRLVGETFVIPLEEDVVIGSAEGGWLVLPEGEVAGVHCWLRASRRGVVTVTDLKAPLGTWIERQKIIAGRLEEGQDLRVGFYRLRLEVVDVTAPVAAVTAVSEGEETPTAVPLGPMESVVSAEGLQGWLVRNRFQLLRTVLLVVGWIAGVQHFFFLYAVKKWTWPWTMAVSLAIAIALLECGRRVALAAPRVNLAAVGVLALLSAVDLVFGMVPSAICNVLMAAAACLLTLVSPRGWQALTGATIATTALAAMLVVVARELPGQIEPLTRTEARPAGLLTAASGPR